MSKLLAIAERDAKSWLQTFSFYLLAALFLTATGYFFWSNLSYFSLVSYRVASNPSLEVRGLNLTEGVLGSFLANVSVLLLLLIPILTMRSFAEEKKQGTLELLLTYPVSDFEIVAGKFLSLLALFAVLILPTIFYFLIAHWVGAKFEWLSVATGYLGLFLVCASFASFGIFVSTLTEHQAVNAGVGFIVLLFFWIIGWMADWVSPALGGVFQELSLVEHFRDFTRGIIDTKDLAFFLFFIGFFLFAALSTLEVRTWKR